jgi:hypothetical protein
LPFRALFAAHEMSRRVETFMDLPISLILTVHPFLRFSFLLSLPRLSGTRNVCPRDAESLSRHGDAAVAFRNVAEE